MKIHADSWHYRRFCSWRVRKRRSAEQPFSLCLYFWAVVLFESGWRLVETLRLKRLAHAIRASRRARRVFQGLFYLYCLAVLAGLLFVFYQNPWFLLAIPGAVAAFGVLIAVIAACVWVADRRGPQIARTGHLLFEFAKAKKRRVCPLIEVER